MTKYELPNGKTVLIPTELLLKLTDDELKDYLATANGFEVNNPFFDSVLEDGENIILLEEFEPVEPIDEIPEGFIEDEE
jgi:hypothetical protein